MPHARSSASFRLSRLLICGGLVLACARGLDPELDELTDEPMGQSGGGGSSAGNGGSGIIPQAGKANGGSGTNPFGGTSSTAGKASGGAATAGSGGAGTAGTGGSAGSSAGGSAAGSGGTAAGGTGGGVCACAKTMAWVDNMVLNWVTGDCVTTAGKTYVYTGTKAQTYANAQCNPAKQEPWCADSGNDYKFMACP